MPTIIGEIINRNLGVPALDESEIRGGYKSVDTELEKEELLSSQSEKQTLKEGSLVYVVENDKTYRYNGTDLVETSGGGEGKEGLGMYLCSTNTASITAVHLTTITIPTGYTLKIGDLLLYRGTGSYVHQVTEINTVNNSCSISYIGSFRGTQGPQGPQGPKGDNGFSPNIEEETKTDTEYTLRITDVDSTFVTPNLKGNKGKDGESPTIEVKTNTSEEYKLTIKNPDGTTFDTPNLKGEKGEDAVGSFLEHYAWSISGINGDQIVAEGVVYFVYDFQSVDNPSYEIPTRISATGYINSVTSAIIENAKNVSIISISGDEANGFSLGVVYYKQQGLVYGEIEGVSFAF